MKVSLELDKKMSFIGRNELQIETKFDIHVASGGDDSAATPMEIMLEALAACSSLDVVSILRKKQREIQNLKVFVDGTQKETHPKYFTKAHLIYELYSADATLEELNKAIELSHTKYCSASAMFQRAGCEVTFDSKIIIQ